MKGLASHTSAIIEPLSRLNFIAPFCLVGGTALSIQLGTRLSEDLDFMSWRTVKNEKREVDWPLIKRELESVGTVEKFDILDLDHVEFIVNGVKVSFYANPNYSPLQQRINYMNNRY